MMLNVVVHIFYLVFYVLYFTVYRTMQKKKLSEQQLRRTEGEIQHIDTLYISRHALDSNK